MIKLTLISILLLTSGPSFAADARSRDLMNKLGLALTFGSKAVNAAQYEPLDDADLVVAIEHLDVAIEVAEGATGPCELDLLPAEVRAHPGDRRAAYATLYRDLMRQYADLMREYRAEFSRQHGLIRVDRTTARLRAQSHALNELARRSHTELRKLAATL